MAWALLTMVGLGPGCSHSLLRDGLPMPGGPQLGVGCASFSFLDFAGLRNSENSILWPQKDASHAIPNSQGIVFAEGLGWRWIVLLTGS